MSSPEYPSPPIYPTAADYELSNAYNDAQTALDNKIATQTTLTAKIADLNSQIAAQQTVCEASEQTSDTAWLDWALTNPTQTNSTLYENCDTRCKDMLMLEDLNNTLTVMNNRLTNVNAQIVTLTETRDNAKAQADYAFLVYASEVNGSSPPPEPSPPFDTSP